jgi:hypothetical protein
MESDFASDFDLESDLDLEDIFDDWLDDVSVAPWLSESACPKATSGDAESASAKARIEVFFIDVFIITPL